VQRAHFVVIPAIIIPAVVTPTVAIAAVFILNEVKDPGSRRDPSPRSG
jgi:hypothetical protein